MWLQIKKILLIRKRPRSSSSQEEDLKRKLQGISILECPRDLEGNRILPTSSDFKSIESKFIPVGDCKQRSVKETSEQNTEQVIDDTFLIASPVTGETVEPLSSERSCLDSVLKNDEAEDIFEHDDPSGSHTKILEPGSHKQLSNEKINPLFINKNNQKTVESVVLQAQ